MSSIFKRPATILPQQDDIYRPPGPWSDEFPVTLRLLLLACFAQAREDRPSFADILAVLRGPHIAAWHAALDAVSDGGADGIKAAVSDMASRVGAMASGGGDGDGGGSGGGGSRGPGDGDVGLERSGSRRNIVSASLNDVTWSGPVALRDAMSGDTDHDADLLVRLRADRGRTLFHACVSIGGRDGLQLASTALDLCISPYQAVNALVSVLAECGEQRGVGWVLPVL